METLTDFKGWKPQRHSISEIPLQLVEAPQDFPNRDEAGDISALQESIAKHGLLQPILVRPSPKKNAYEIICGARRFEAARRNLWETIPAVIYDDVSDQKLLSYRMIENLHRKDLEVHEKVMLLQQLHTKYGLSQDDLAIELRLSKPRIREFLQLTSLPEDVLMRVVDGTHLNMAPQAFTVSKALVLATAGLPEDKVRLYVQRIRKVGMSTQQLKNVIRGKPGASLKLDLYTHRWENVRSQLRKLRDYCKIQGYECSLTETETCSTFKLCRER